MVPPGAMPAHIWIVLLGKTSWQKTNAGHKETIIRAITKADLTFTDASLFSM